MIFHIPCNSLQTANGGGSLLPSPRYGNPNNGNPRPRSLILQKVDGDYSSANPSTNPSRRNSDVMSRINSTKSNYENQLERERKQVSENVTEGNAKLNQAKSNLSDDLAYVQAGARRASKYDLY